MNRQRHSFVLASTIAVLALSPRIARAAGSGVELGLRTGVSIPFGKIVATSGGDAALNDSVSAGIPVQADLGYRFNPYFYAGVYGGYSSLFPKGCPNGADCSAHTFRIGGNVQFHPAGDVPTDPWFGIGFGYEWLKLSQSGVGTNQNLDVNGFEFANLQGGVDFALEPTVKLGPFLTFSLAEYRYGSTSGSFGSGSGELSGKKVHEWLMIGIRAAFLP